VNGCRSFFNSISTAGFAWQGKKCHACTLRGISNGRLGAILSLNALYSLGSAFIGKKDKPEVRFSLCLHINCIIRRESVAESVLVADGIE
jgi:hypothetical protein